MFPRKDLQQHKTFYHTIISMPHKHELILKIPNTKQIKETKNMKKPVKKLKAQPTRQ